MIGKLSKFFILLGFALVSFGIAQEVIVTNPSTWFASQETIFIVAGLIVPWITKVFTALGKDWFHTDGKATQWLSLAVAIIIAGVGGYLSLGFLAGVSGLQGAIQAAILTAIAFLGSNGMAKSERQVAVSAVKRMSVEMDEQRLAALSDVRRLSVEKDSTK